MKSFLRPAWLVLVLPVQLACAADRPLNVLFIAVDDLRPETGCYCNPLAHTPNIDRIAARGVVFNRAYCQQAVCSPSRSSLLTGRRPDATKVWDLETHFRVALPECITLPQHFKQNGYHCAALGKIYEHEAYEQAGPGFLRSQMMPMANMTATEKAWPRTIAFLRKYVEGSGARPAAGQGAK